MAEYTVRFAEMRKTEAALEQVSRRMAKLSDQIERIGRSTALNGTNAFAGVRRSLRSQGSRTEILGEQTGSMRTALGDIAGVYERIERELMGFQLEVAPDVKVGQAKKESGADSKPQESGSVLSGELSGSTELPGGINAAGMVSGELLGYSHKKKGEFGITYKKNKETGEYELDGIGAEIGIEGEGHAAKGKVKGSIGFLSGETEGAIGKVSGSGSLGASLFRDGKFAPNLHGKIDGEATAVEGSAKTSVGTENNNAHISADGKLLTAEGKGEVAAGVITYEDDDGETKTGIGVKAEIGGEAYLATGKVKGGFTIFGVNIDIGVKGHLGGGSAKAGGHITSGGIGGSLDVGFLAGLGLDFNIDWSNFKFGW